MKPQRAERPWIVAGAVSGFIAVAAGAFGAHGLKGKIEESLLEAFKTGALYQLHHALALVLAGLVAARFSSRAAVFAGGAFLAGTILFSGSLYLMALTGARAWGAVTPFGGMAFLMGWGALAAATLGRRAL